MGYIFNAGKIGYPDLKKLYLVILVLGSSCYTGYSSNGAFWYPSEMLLPDLSCINGLESNEWHCVENAH